MRKQHRYSWIFVHPTSKCLKNVGFIFYTFQCSPTPTPTSTAPNCDPLCSGVRSRRGLNFKKAEGGVSLALLRDYLGEKQ